MGSEGPFQQPSHALRRPLDFLASCLLRVLAAQSNSTALSSQAPRALADAITVLPMNNAVGQRMGSDGRRDADGRFVRPSAFRKPRGACAHPARAKRIAAVCGGLSEEV